MVNGEPSSFFKAIRGIRQGDSLSPFLFIIVMEVLNKLFLWVKNLDLIKGLILGEEKGAEEVSHLVFANDILVVCQSDVNSLLNLRCVLLCFLAISNLNINLTKFDMVKLGDGMTLPG